MFDIEKMIKCIEANPAIWDVCYRLHTDKALKERSWNNVGEKMFQGWWDLTDEDREEDVRMMKNKWRHICDDYIKFKNHCHKEGGIAKCDFIHENALSFLQQVPVIPVNHRIIDSFSDEGSESEMSSSFTEEQTSESVVGTSHSVPNNETKIRSPSMRPKTSCITPYQKNIRDPFNCQQLDADRSFLLSILPDYNRLTCEKKINFRLCILQFLKNANQVRNGKTSKVHNNCPWSVCRPSSHSRLENHKTKQGNSQQNYSTYSTFVSIPKPKPEDLI